MPLPGRSSCPARHVPGEPGDVADRERRLPRLLAARSTATRWRSPGCPRTQWSYDPLSGTGLRASARGRRTAGSSEALLPDADGRRSCAAADGDADGVDPAYLDTDRRRPAGRRDRAARSPRTRPPTSTGRRPQDYFTGPDSPFRYSLQTAPGNGDDALVEFLTVGPRRLLRAVRLGDGGDAAHGRRPGPGRRRVHRRAPTTGDGTARSAPRTRTPGSRRGSPAAGWTTFDPTPLTDGRAIVPPYVRRRRGETATRRGRRRPRRPRRAAPEDDGGAGRRPPEPADARPRRRRRPPRRRAGGPGVPARGRCRGARCSRWSAVAPAAWRARQRRRRLAAAAPVAPERPTRPGRSCSPSRPTAVRRRSRATPSRTAAARLVREHGLDGRAQQALRRGGRSGRGELVRRRRTRLRRAAVRRRSGPVSDTLRAVPARPAPQAASRLGHRTARPRPGTAAARGTRRPPRRPGADRATAAARITTGARAPNGDERVTPARSGGGSALPSGR